MQKLDDLFGRRAFMFYVNEGVKYGKLVCRYKSCPFQYWFRYELDSEMPSEVVNIIFDRSINTNHLKDAHFVKKPEEKSFNRYRSIVQVTSELICSNLTNKK